jgi:hypothetical protein
MDNYVWLRRTRQRWKLVLQVWLGIYGFLVVLASLVFLVVAMFAGARALWIPGILWAGYGLGRAIDYWVVYHSIRCPQCGVNPTRRKKDGMRMSERSLYSHLARLEGCPACGFRGDCP